MGALSLLFRNWKLAAVIGGFFATVALYSLAINSAYNNGKTSGYNAAAAECAERFEAASASREAQIRQIEADERLRRNELQNRLDEQADRIRDLDTELSRQNREAQEERENAIFEALEDFRRVGVSCPIGDGLRDDYAADVSAFNSGHNNGVRGSGTGPDSNRFIGETESPSID